VPASAGDNPRDGVLEWEARVSGGAEENRYHPLNPHGLYGSHYLREHFVRLTVGLGIRVDQAEILDLGSGKGAWCRYFAELKGTTEGIVGIEQSPGALAYARRLSDITYVEGDMVDVGRMGAGDVDLVTAFVSFMFLKDAEELAKVLAGINDRLRPGGHVLVYEKDTPHAPGESWSGWPRQQMTDLLTGAGLEVVASEGLFKVFLGRLDSYRDVSYRRMDWMRVAERVLPGRWGYYFVLARKPDAAAP
jgi:SAM-dependent methyltransferase